MGSIAQTKPLKERIAHTSSATFKTLSAPHCGAGSMAFAPLFETDALSSNLIFLHCGIIEPRSGIGHHFHNQCEEMFIILDGEAEFTIDGRTSLLKGPAGAPCRMGHSHGIYNPTDKPVQWLNFNVGMSKTYDSFDLGDDCTNKVLDPIPQFITLRLDHKRLKPEEGVDGSSGLAQYHRALHPSVFSTTWASVDHVKIHPGANVHSPSSDDITQVIYVMSGDGEITVNDESVGISKGDAVPIDLSQSYSLRGQGDAPLEVMSFAVAKDMASKAHMMSAVPALEHKF